LRKRRIVFFLLTILVGLAAGLVYGWVVNPLDKTSQEPAALRMDYKTDYVLMVAEIFYDEQDISRAQSDLLFLGEQDGGELVESALNYATQVGYSAEDIMKIRLLRDSLAEMAQE